MYERSSSLLLHWLKVPAEPQPPHGDPASLRVFRAGKNFFNLRLAGWAITQAFALAGIIFWRVVFLEVEAAVEQRRQSHDAPVVPTNAKNFEDYMRQVSADVQARAEREKPAEVAPANPADPSTAAKVEAKPTPKRARPRVRINGWASFKALLVESALYLPRWSFPLLWVLKITGIIAYLVQIPFTYAIRRLDYEMRWYMVTDRSLRIRHGVWNVSESTMSFANIQQVEISQNPVQRVLGLADVRVQSAGGGSAIHQHKQHGEDMHLGLFHSVTNAPEIRDLILERLRRFRETGLGDPDEKTTVHPVPAAAPAIVAGSDAVAAARELLAEAKALRAAL